MSDDEPDSPGDSRYQELDKRLQRMAESMEITKRILERANLLEKFPLFERQRITDTILYLTKPSSLRKMGFHEQDMAAFYHELRAAHDEVTDVFSDDVAMDPNVHKILEDAGALDDIDLFECMYYDFATLQEFDELDLRRLGVKMPEVQVRIVDAVRPDRGPQFGAWSGVPVLVFRFSELYAEDEEKFPPPQSWEEALAKGLVADFQAFYEFVGGQGMLTPSVPTVDLELRLRRLEDQRDPNYGELMEQLGDLILKTRNKYDRRLIQFIGPPLRLPVAEDGFMLYYHRDDQTEEMVVAAVRNNPYAIKMARQRFRDPTRYPLVALAALGNIAKLCGLEQPDERFSPLSSIRDGHYRDDYVLSDKTEEIWNCLVFPGMPEPERTKGVFLSLERGDKNLEKYLDFVLEAVKVNPCVFFLMPYRQQHGIGDSNVAVAAVRANPELILLLSFHGNYERFTKVLEANPIEVTGNPEIVEVLFGRDYEIRENIPFDNPACRDAALQILKTSPRLWRDNIRNQDFYEGAGDAPTEEFAAEAIRNDFRVHNYMEPELLATATVRTAYESAAAGSPLGDRGRQLEHGARALPLAESAFVDVSGPHGN